jgi:glycerol-3-phosphate dehydrogenase
MADFDLAVIGAGASGTAVARDAAGRGISVLLIEQGDLGSGASLGSAMLMRNILAAWPGVGLGGIHAALAERETMLTTAPHLARALRILLLPQDARRSPLFLRACLFACDRLARRRILPATRIADLTHHPFGIPLRRQFEFGFSYADCRIDEVRLPIANARDAADRGAEVRTHTRCRRAERGEIWTLALNIGGERRVVTARALVNAAGIAVQHVAGQVLGVASAPAIRCVKASYILAPPLFDHDGGYLLPDPRQGGYVLALPFAPDATMIGPLEEDVCGEPAAPTVAAEAIAALCALANHYFRRAIEPKDVTPYASVRATPLSRTRRPAAFGAGHVVAFDRPPGRAPLITISGGTALMARRIAESVVDRLTRFFSGAPAWTARMPLPGGDFPVDGFARLVEAARHRWPFLSEGRAHRLVSSYGTRVERVLGGAAQASDLGDRICGDLAATEVQYLMREEWAEAAEDVLWRRSRLGLDCTAGERDALSRFMADARHPATSARASDQGVAAGKVNKV